jgi:ferric-dicitrate binding protein FerR (iron transport regulator)
LEIVIEDPVLARRRLTATFDGESRSTVLEVLAQTLGARVDVRGDTAHIRPGR